MKRLLLLCVIVVLFTSKTHGQTVLFSQDFENTFLVNSTGTLNHFIVNNCAGNGPSQTGTKAAYIAPNIMTTGDCSTYSNTFYGINQSSTAEEISFDIVLQVACAQNLTLQFDYKKHNASLAAISYRILGTTPWILISNLNNSASWTTFTQALPIELNNQEFELKFSNLIDNYDQNYQPLAIDNIIVEGTTDGTPQITCPTSFDYPLSAGCTPILPNLTGVASLEHVCPAFVSFTQNPIAGTVVPASQVVTITMTDQFAQSRSCSFTANGVDLLGPELTCPQNFQQARDANCTAFMMDLRSEIQITDNCSAAGDMIIEFNLAIGTSLIENNNLITVRVTDELNHTSFCSFNLELIDNTPPTLTDCPTSVNIYKNVNCEAIVPLLFGNVTATDNCTHSSSIFINQVPSVNSIITANTFASITAQDENQNTSECLVQLILLDTLAPIIDCATPIIVPSTSDCSLTIPNLSEFVDFSDNCTTTQFLFNQSLSPGSTAQGSTAVNFTVTDQSGNSQSCLITVLPEDLIPPLITCPAAQTVNTTGNCEAILSSYVIYAPVIDNCSNYTIDQSPTVGTALTVGIHPITLTVTDIGNNTAQCIFELTIIDNTPATLICPSNVENCGTYVEYPEPAVTGSCSGQAINISSSGLTSGEIFPIGITTITYQVQGAINSPSCSFTVTVIDSTITANVLTPFIALCNENSLTIAASPASGGLWSFNGNNSTIINNPNEAITGVNGLTAGNYQFIWTVNNGICGLSSDTILVNNNMPASVTIQNTEEFACNSNYHNLSALSTTAGIWTSTTNVRFAVPTAMTTTVTDMPNGWTTYYYTANPIQGCPTAKDSIRIFKTADIAFEALDSIYCYSYNLRIPVPNYTLDGVTNSVWGSSNINTIELDSITFFTGFLVGGNNLTLTLNYENCPPRTQYITITTESCGDLTSENLVNLITPNGDGDNDEFLLDFTYNEIKIFDRSGVIVFHDLGNAPAWNATNPKGEKVPIGVYFYTIRTSDDSDKDVKGSITVIY